MKLTTLLTAFAACSLAQADLDLVKRSGTKLTQAQAASRLSAGGVGWTSSGGCHANGYKFDFAKNTALNSYVTNTFTKIANRADGYPQWQAASGNIYCDEGNHWDVTFY
ncbi:hypothetical protein ONZ43_g6739 [Nemania bipapillata]|uniref:Uncharacterized protein n=1 Tax=Nemania bipapillata TaxID=110536 RepID=A0ACC2HXF2_9PEZI|nr:hypothetical protein ONZ43_g6739 [Nemania bipapillata]